MTGVNFTNFTPSDISIQGAPENSVILGSSILSSHIFVNFKDVLKLFSLHDPLMFWPLIGVSRSYGFMHSRPKAGLQPNEGQEKKVDY